MFVKITPHHEEYVLAGKLTRQLFAGHAGHRVNSVKCEQQGYGRRSHPFISRVVHIHVFGNFEQALPS